MLGKRTRSASTRFHLVLIKPSHYDDDGYPIQWVKAAIPSNTLACLNGLAEDARQQNADAKKMEAIEAKLQQKNEVMAELMGEHLALKKKLGLI